MAGSGQLRRSGGQRPRSHEAEDNFGGLAEASFPTPLGGVVFLLLYYFALRIKKFIAMMVLIIEVLIKLLEAIPQIPSVATNVIKFIIPENGGHFERRTAIGRRNTPHQSYVKRTVIKFALA